MVLMMCGKGERREGGGRGKGYKNDSLQHSSQVYRGRGEKDGDLLCNLEIWAITSVSASCLWWSWRWRHLSSNERTKARSSSSSLPLPLFQPSARPSARASCSVLAPMWSRYPSGRTAEVTKVVWSTIHPRRTSDEVKSE